MAAKGGKFVSGRGPKKVISKPTDSGYKVTTKTPGGTTTPTPPGPTTIVTKDDGVVIDTTTSASPQRAARASARAVARKERKKRAVALSKVPGREKRSQSVKPQPVLKQAKAKAIAVKAPKTKPDTFEGKKTAGTPTLKELKQGSESGTIKVNQKGFVTTAPVRKAVKQVKKAKKAVAKAQVKGVPSGVPKGWRKPIARNAPLVDKVAEERYGITGAELLAKTFKGESNFNQKAVGPETPYGRARKAGQFIPPTRDEFVEKFGIDPWGNKAEVTKAMAYHLDGKHYGSGGVEGYNPGMDPSYYLNQDVGKASAKTTNPKAAKKLAKAKAGARKLGLEVGKKGAKESYPAMKAKKLDGAWAGSRKAVMDVVKGLPWGSGKRTPAENAAVGGATESDHLTTKKNAFAADLGPGTDVAETIAKRLKLSGWAPGTYERFTSPKYPGYTFQLLWEVEGHYDHVHIGAEWTGEDLPAGTYEGGAGLGGGSSVGGAVGSSAISAYAAATGQSVKAVKAKMKQKKLGPAQILKKLDSLKVRQGTPTTQTKESAPSTSTLEALERKYGLAA